MLSWEEKIPSSFKQPTDTQFHKILVPTIDTYRIKHMIETLMKFKQNTLIIGDTGVGKSTLITNALNLILANDLFI